MRFKGYVKSFLKRAGMYDFFYQKVYENRVVFKVLKCAWRYHHLVRRAKSKPRNEKIRVLFIVSEIAKWKEQSLYEAMDKSADFFPIVGISAWNNQNERVISSSEYQRVQECAERFFDRLGDRHVRTITIENGNWVYHNLYEFSPDIVFYTEQWAPCRQQHPFDVSKCALTCFLPYYVPDFGIANYDCYQQVERMSWTYFCLAESWRRLYQRYLWFMSYTAKFIPTGHPALDYIGQNRDRTPEEGYVIYAPHWAFPHPGQDDIYIIGTFPWNGREILAYAEAHLEVKWVFKPHPLLRRTLIRSGVMTQEEVESYFDRWSKIAKVCMDGNYQELFIQSRAMVTDCGSFLPEYGSTGRPVIRLICSQNRYVPPAVAKNVYDTYYQVHNIEELYATFKLVIEGRQDPKKESRLVAIQEAGLYESKASQNIMNYLLKTFGRQRG